MWIKGPKHSYSEEPRNNIACTYDLRFTVEIELQSVVEREVLLGSDISEANAFLCACIRSSMRGD